MLWYKYSRDVGTIGQSRNSTNTMFSIAAVASAAVFGAKAGAPMMKLNNGVMMPQVALGKLWCRNEVVWTGPLAVLYYKR
jgi:hypothetical protein